MILPSHAFRDIWKVGRVSLAKIAEEDAWASKMSRRRERASERADGCVPHTPAPSVSLRTTHHAIGRIRHVRSSSHLPPPFPSFLSQLPCVLVCVTKAERPIWALMRLFRTISIACSHLVLFRRWFLAVFPHKTTVIASFSEAHAHASINWVVQLASKILHMMLNLDSADKAKLFVEVEPSS